MAKSRKTRKGARRAGESKSRWPRRLLHAGLAFLSVAILLIAAGVLWLSRDLPDIDVIAPLPGEAPLEVRADDGSLLARYGQLRGDWLSFEEIPPPMVNAILAIEDRRFFSHPGFDLQGILRALRSNISAGRVREGGSTITQQLAKNLFLSPERTLTRKARELLLAFQLEERYTKEEILAIYLNRVYLGAGTFGIDAAARVYFNHSARQLTIPEAALIAGLVKAPSRLAPTSDGDAAKRRARIVLKAMVEARYLPQGFEIEQAIESIDFEIEGDQLGPRYFTDWVAIQARHKVGAERRTIVVYSTLSTELQGAAEEAVMRHLDKDGARLDARQAALVSLAPRGAIKAMVGGRDYQQSVFNRAVQAKRQPGSAFKPFVYLAAFEAGFTPDTPMRDSPVVFGDWRPQNFGGGHVGIVSLREAFSRSINTVAVKLSERVDRDRVISAAYRMGISSRVTPHPSVALGTSEVSLLELTGAYATIANGGYLATPYAIEQIRSGEGALIYARPNSPPRRIVGARERVMLVDVMMQTMTAGTGRQAAIARPAAGKTGTSQDYRDAWFVGFTAHHVTGVWVGNDDNSPMANVTGGGLPARLWADYMRSAEEGLQPRPLLARADLIARDDRLSDNDALSRADTADERRKARRKSFWKRLFNKN